MHLKTSYSKTAVITTLADHELRLRAVTRENETLKNQNLDLKRDLFRELQTLKARIAEGELKRKRPESSSEAEVSTGESSGDENLVSEAEREAIEHSANAGKSTVLKVRTLNQILRLTLS